MEWTPEAVKAEVDRRHQVAQHSALVRQIRQSQGPRPSWWRRLRSHERDSEPGDPGDPGEEGHLRSGLDFESDSAA
jgi:hypothetical protein